MAPDMSSNGLIYKDYDLGPVNFNDTVDYICKNMKKMDLNFDNTTVTTICRENNYWENPTWPQCVESKLIINIVILKAFLKLFILPAKYCTASPPPKIPNGYVTVLNAGLYYGSTCIGTDVKTNLPGSGCSNSKIQLISILDDGTDPSKSVHTYQIEIDVALSDPEFIVAIMTFTQKVPLVDFTLEGGMVME